MSKTSEPRNILKELLESQKFAVLATQSGGQPYANLMAFAVTRDLKSIILATTRTTRKFANLSRDPRVAVLFDNRSNTERDFDNAATVTATGQVNEVGPGNRKRFRELYLAKHPHLREFVTSSTCALLKIEVETYYVVTRFQNVMELHMKQ